MAQKCGIYGLCGIPSKWSFWFVDLYQVKLFVNVNLLFPRYPFCFESVIVTLHILNVGSKYNFEIDEIFFVCFYSVYMIEKNKFYDWNRLRLDFPTLCLLRPWRSIIHTDSFVSLQFLLSTINFGSHMVRWMTVISGNIVSNRIEDFSCFFRGSAVLNWNKIRQKTCAYNKMYRDMHSI